MTITSSVAIYLWLLGNDDVTYVIIMKKFSALWSTFVRASNMHVTCTESHIGLAHTLNRRGES